MDRAQLIKCLEDAEKLLKEYGFAPNVDSNKAGLPNVLFAIGLTALPQDVVKRIAPLVAKPGGRRGWSEVSGSDRAYYDVFSNRKTSVENQLDAIGATKGVSYRSSEALPTMIRRLNARPKVRRWSRRR
jgi:hypothetical protein